MDYTQDINYLENQPNDILIEILDKLEVPNLENIFRSSKNISDRLYLKYKDMIDEYNYQQMIQPSYEFYLKGLEDQYKCVNNIMLHRNMILQPHMLS